eukprot:CAMPEP_0117432830 /NCGR_PEP_ID=MMETSP0758-20121206/12257_1 /TAXON_ID=63605 /ORGANISM="Percolomonas cosmopolitus, Strain AE-1 (ATCC 50343)" /LENGTH=586 /DNA_ID=CAMNT_0005223017 /DNA_START=186 /DNA_END=1943 /DNA_ORIENTATION=-
MTSKNDSLNNPNLPFQNKDTFSKQRSSSSSNDKEEDEQRVFEPLTLKNIDPASANMEDASLSFSPPTDPSDDSGEPHSDKPTFTKEQLEDMRFQIRQLDYIGKAGHHPTTVPVNYEILKVKESSKFLISLKELPYLSALESDYYELFYRRSFEEAAADYFERSVSFIHNVAPALLTRMVNRGILSLEYVLLHPSILMNALLRVKEVVVKEALHFGRGCKQFGKDVFSGLRNFLRSLRGYTLSWREKRSLRQTLGDIFRIVPFSLFVLIPAAEVLLPFALKAFPGMLPSQFKTSILPVESEKKKAKKANLADFLRDSASLILKYSSEKMDDEGTRRELLSFMDRLKSPTYRVSNGELIRFSDFFTDTFAFDDMPRSHLVAMCTLLNSPTFGSNAYLRYSLRKKLRKLRAEDKDIYFQGVNSLTMEELVIACSERAMKTGVSKKQLRHQLSEWIQLSLDFNIPSSLLLLSRAFHHNVRDDHLFEALSREDDAAAKRREALRSSLISLSHSHDDVMLQRIIQDIHDMPLSDVASLIGEIDETLSSHVRSTLLEAIDLSSISSSSSSANFSNNPFHTPSSSSSSSHVRHL